MIDLLKFLGGTTVAIGAVAWIVRTLMVHVLSKDVKAYEAHLRLKYDFEMERLRNDLQRQRLENELRVRRVDEIVANSLSEVYGRLCELWDAARDFVHHAPKDDDDYNGKEQRVKAAEKAFAQTLLRNRINLPQELWDETRRYSAAMDKVIGARWTAGQAEREQERDAACHKMEEAVTLLGDAGGVLDAIVAAYQERLGIIDSGQDKAATPSTRPAGWER
jgi:RNase H-fold protein (predicted Holliday junction resolvase)